MELYDVIIIGAGPSGVTASIYGIRANLKILLIEKGPIGGKIIDITKLENYPGYIDSPGTDLAMNFRKQIKNLNIPLIKDEVLLISKEDSNFIVQCRNNVFNTKRVILATGTKENKMNLLNEDRFLGQGISFCATCDGSFYKNKVIAIYGGGNSAIDASFYLSPIAKHIYLIARHNLICVDSIKNKLLEKNNITIIENTIITKLNGDKELNSIETLTNNENTNKLDVEGLFVYIGSTPDLSFIKNLNLSTSNNYINVDKNFETNVHNVFAIGDVINKELRQIVTATNDGALVINYIIKSLI